MGFFHVPPKFSINLSLVRFLDFWFRFFLCCSPLRCSLRVAEASSHTAWKASKIFNSWNSAICLHEVFYWNFVGSWDTSSWAFLLSFSCWNCLTVLPSTPAHSLSPSTAAFLTADLKLKFQILIIFRARQNVKNIGS